MKTLKNNSYSFESKFYTLAIVLMSLIVQVVLVGKYLDNSIISPYVPTASDALDYAERAETWRADGFTKAFSDAYRMPGYPFLILVMQSIFPSAPYLGIRLLQMFALAISAGIIKISLQKFTSPSIAIIASTMYIVLPVWHFMPLVLAESLTAVTVVFLIFTLSQVVESGINKRQIIIISMLVALATYLKPNNLLLIFAVSSYLIFKIKSRLLISLSSIFLSVSFFLAPWFLYGANMQPGFFGLTTNSGANLYTGTGMKISYDGGVLAKSAQRWQVDQQNNPEDIFKSAPSLSPSQLDSAMKKKSIEIWMKRPLDQFGFALDKILIAFGLKSDSVLDHLFGLVNLISVLAGIVLLKVKKFRAWGSSILVTVSLLALQAAVFQADRRFVVPVLFPFAVICIGLALGVLSLKVSAWRRARGTTE